MEQGQTFIMMDNLLTERYGSDAPRLFEAVDSVTQVLLEHKSVRKYKPDPLPAGTLELLCAAAQSAATSSNLQTWSVIALQDPARKSEAAMLSGNQEFIRQAPLFLIFCADLSRLTRISDQIGLPGEGLEYLEMFLMATIDASLAAQNAAAVAEANGLGICYVGGARNNPRELAALLGLPPRVVGLFGMTVGIPSENDTSAVKPRLPQSAILHLETYNLEAESIAIEHYNATMNAFYNSQNMNVDGDWSRHSAERVATPANLSGRHILREILQQLGFDLK